MSSYTSPPAAGSKLRAATLQSLITELRPPTAIKASDGTPVNNSTVLVADSELVVALEASVTYAFRGYLVVSSGTTPDVKFGNTVPSGATGSWSMVAGPTTEATVVVGNVDMGAASLTVAHTRAAAGVGTSMVNLMFGYIVMSSTAGNFTLTMAQGTATASDTVLKAGSWIQFQRAS